MIYTCIWNIGKTGGDLVNGTGHGNDVRVAGWSWDDQCRCPF